MTDRRTDLLARECRVFARYLTGEPPSSTVVEAYCAGHEARSDELGAAGDETGGVLLTMARRGPRWSWLADCYGRVHEPDGPLRRKLLLLVAVLESAPSTSPRFGRPSRDRATAVLWRLVRRAASFATGAAVATLIFFPLRGLARLSGRTTWSRDA